MNKLKIILTHYLLKIKYKWMAFKERTTYNKVITEIASLLMRYSDEMDFKFHKYFNEGAINKINKRLKYLNCNCKEKVIYNTEEEIGLIFEFQLIKKMYQHHKDFNKVMNQIFSTEFIKNYLT